MKRRLEWMLVLLVLILGASACDDDDDNGNRNNDLTTEDRNFMHDAALANLAEIEMGTLAIDSADSVTSDSMVQVFAARMVAEHTAAWNELEVLADDKDVDLPNQPDQAHQDRMDYLRTLHGAQFDSAYVESQVQDHQAAVTLFQQAKTNADNDEVRAYATKYLPHIQEHLTDAITLRDSIQTQTKIGIGIKH